MPRPQRADILPSGIILQRDEQQSVTAQKTFPREKSHEALRTFQILSSHINPPSVIIIVLSYHYFLYHKKHSLSLSLRASNDAKPIRRGYDAGLGARGAQQVKNQDPGPSRPEGGEPGPALRGSGADDQEGRRRFQQEGGSGRQREKTGRGGRAGVAGPGLVKCQAGYTEGAAGEEDEPIGPGQTDQREAPGGPGVRERKGRAEPGRTGEDGEGSGREAEGKDWEVIVALETT